MGLYETEAIVLRTFNLAEADKIIVCLTRNGGVVRAVARGAKRLKSRFGAGLEPFTVIQLTYFEKEGSELVSLRQLEIIRSFFDLTKTTEVFTAMSYMCELVMEFSPPHEPNERIFRMLRAVMEALSQTPERLSSLVRYFELWILKLSGFLPDLRSCAACGVVLDGSSSAYLNAELRLNCAHCSQRAGREINATAQARLRSAQRLPPADFANTSIDLNVEDKNELTNLIQSLIARALERQPRSQATFN